MRKTAYLRASVRVVGRAVADAILRLAVRVVGAAGGLHLGPRGRRRRDLRVGVSVLLSTRLVEAGLVVLLDVVRGLGGERRGSHGRSSGGTEASAKGLESVAARHWTGEGRGTDKEGELSTKRWTNGMRGEAHKEASLWLEEWEHYIYICARFRPWTKHAAGMECRRACTLEDGVCISEATVNTSSHSRCTLRQQQRSQKGASSTMICLEGSCRRKRPCLRAALGDRDV